MLVVTSVGEHRKAPLLVTYGDDIVPVGNDKFGILDTGNRDVGSDDVNNALDMREIILRVKPELLSRLKSVAAGAA